MAVPTVQSVVTRALQKLGVVAAGNLPDTADNALALDALKGVYRHLRTAGAFGKVYEVFPTAGTTSYNVEEGDHVIRTDDSVSSVNLPESVANYTTVSDYGLTSYSADENSIRAPRDMSYAAITDQSTGITQDWLYDGQIARWMCIESLTFNDPCPLAFRDINGLAACLAMNVADEFGQQPSPLTQKAAMHFEAGVAMNWSEAGEEIIRNLYF